MTRTLARSRAEDRRFRIVFDCQITCSATLSAVKRSSDVLQQSKCSLQSETEGVKYDLIRLKPKPLSNEHYFA